MTERFGGPQPVRMDEGGMTLLGLASVLLRNRRRIVLFAFVGAVVGLLSGLLSTRMYRSTATFIPQGSEGSASSLSIAASQFGIRLPSSGGNVWGPPLYVELLRSRSLLEAVSRESVTVVETGNRAMMVRDVLGVKATDPAERDEAVTAALRGIVSATEVKPIGAVRVAVTSPWPSFSRDLAERLVAALNRFNLETRKSQAAAERSFVERQTAAAERELRTAEDRLASFLQRNRQFASPELSFEQERLQREVTLRQQVYTSLVQSLEEAKIREVRDLPVLTLIEAPTLPVTGEARKTVVKAFLGVVLGAILGVLVALVSHAAGVAKQASGEGAEFFSLLGEATPRFLRRAR